MTNDAASLPSGEQDAGGDTPRRAKRVFVSYSRKDKDRVTAIVRAIEGLSHDVWWDDRLVAGARFTAETEERLKTADFVVVVWTAESVTSEWVLDEAQVGKSDRKLVPISLDGQEPPLGFRHIHTIRFAKWNGEAGADCVGDLARALRGDRPMSDVDPFRREGASGGKAGGAKGRLAMAALVAAGVSALAVTGFIATDQAAKSERRMELALAALSSGSVDAQRAPVAQAALREIVNSKRSEDQAALESFGRGDAFGALDLLEGLAADLERSGDRKAAAEAYTRAAAIALMIDQGRGLASRRKAFELAPHSLTAFHGLFWDLFLLQGFEPARALAQSVADTPSSPDALQALAYALMANVSADNWQYSEAAEEYRSRLKSMRDRSDDPDVAAAAVFADYIVAWRQDRLADAEQSLDQLSSLVEKIDYPQIYPIDVGIARIRYSKGDWDGLFDFSRSALEARQRAGLTSPGPLQFFTCIVGLYTGAGDEAATYCEAQSRQLDPVGGARARLSRALALAVNGEVDLAQREVAASRALAPSNPQIEVDRLRIEVEIAAARGNLDEAEAVTNRFIDSLAGLVNEKSRKAHVFRRFGTLAIRVGEPSRACEPLRRSRELYRAIGGSPGAAAVTSMLDTAGCPK